MHGDAHTWNGIMEGRRVGPPNGDTTRKEKCVDEVDLSKERLIDKELACTLRKLVCPPRRSTLSLDVIKCTTLT